MSEIVLSYLVGGFTPPENYEFVSWDDDIPNWMESHKTCSKPPTSYAVIAKRSLGTQKVIAGGCWFTLKHGLLWWKKP